MKRFLVVLLTVALVLAAVGCAPTATGEAAAITPSASETVAQSAAPSVSDAQETATTKDKPVIGYVISTLEHEWYQNIVKGATARAEELGYELKTANAEMDSSLQVSQIENMITLGVDVIIVTPVDAEALTPVVAEATKAGIPVICESNKVEGAASLVAIDSYTGGYDCGTWFAEYATENNIDPQILMVGLPDFEDCRQRVAGFKAGMDAAGLKYTVAAEVNGNGAKEQSMLMSQDALTAHPEVNVIFGINDNSASGGRAAYVEAGLDESKLTVIGFGFEGAVGRDLLLGDTSYKAACAMFPDYMGVSLVDACQVIIDGQTIEPERVSNTIVITKENFSQFYTDNGDGTYTTNFDAIRALSK